MKLSFGNHIFNSYEVKRLNAGNIVEYNATSRACPYTVYQYKVRLVGDRVVQLKKPNKLFNIKNNPQYQEQFDLLTKKEALNTKQLRLF